MKSNREAPTQMQIAVIVTVLNEEATIEALLHSIVEQTRLPDEVVIVDGGSNDLTVKKMLAFAKQVSKFPIKVLQHNGNRSVGRNVAIAAATSKLIAITDAGCVLEPTWLEELLRAHAHEDVRVVSGYYRADPKTRLQEAMVPYVFVMPDVVDPNTFLPATRSMLIEKTTWMRAGRFDETLSDNEDYAFAKRLEVLEVPRAFAPKAVVVWQPVSTLPQFFKMLYRFAKGDIFSGIVRPKVLLLFARYVIALLLVVGALLSSLLALLNLQISLSLFATELSSFVVLGFLLYLIWSIAKNYRYVKKAWYWLPVLQLLADGAVLSGSLAGLRQKRTHSIN